jgi:hypothetical protein
MKKQKRRHAWKAKYVRKHWSLSRCRGKIGWGAPKSYVKGYFSTDRNKERIACIKLMQGFDESDVYFPRRHRHSASWDYW